MKNSFEVEGHIIRFDWSLFGLERYWVDEEQVLKKWSFSLKGTRTLIIGEGHNQHTVLFKVDMFPSVKRWLVLDWIAEVYVDGELMIEDVTPRTRRTLKFWTRLLDSITVAVILLIVFMLLIFG